MARLPQAAADSIFPRQFLERIAVDPRADGSLSVSVFLQNLQAPGEVLERLFDQELQPVGDQSAVAVDAETSEVTLAGQFSAIAPWTSESPHRYRLAVELHDENGAVHAAPDGIVGPYRQKEGSCYTVRQVWSPVQVELDELPVS